MIQPAGNNNNQNNNKKLGSVNDKSFATTVADNLQKWFSKADDSWLQHAACFLPAKNEAHSSTKRKQTLTKWKRRGGKKKNKQQK